MLSGAVSSCRGPKPSLGSCRNTSGEVRGFQRDQQPAESLHSFLPTTSLLGSQSWSLAINCFCGLFITASPYQTRDTKAESHPPPQVAEPASQLAAPEREKSRAPSSPAVPLCLGVLGGTRQTFARAAGEQGLSFHQVSSHLFTRPVSEAAHRGGGQQDTFLWLQLSEAHASIL